LTNRLRQRVNDMEEHLTIITGHYGSGKTEFAVNLAFRLAKGGRAVTLADLDIVNPYFCSRERKEILTQSGVRVIASKWADADLPAINPEVYALLENGVCGIMDVGGDAVGAQVLGRFSHRIADIRHELLCVVNFNRPETSTAKKAENYLRQIEYSARLKVTGLVNNTHMDRDTTVHDVLRGAGLTKTLGEASGIPVKFHAYDERLNAPSGLPLEKLFPMRLFMKKPWEL
jgi:hypothetical protein